MILYHGTTKKFEKFSMEFIGANGTSEGIGLYFTDSKDVAYSYAYPKGRVFSISFEEDGKCLPADEITLTRSELEILLLSLHKSRDILNDFNDVSYYGVTEVLNYAIDLTLESSNDNLDILCSLAHTCGDSEEVLRICNEILGYDYSKVQATWNSNPNKRQTIYLMFKTDLDIIAIEDYKVPER